MNNYIPTNSVTENIEKFIETYSLLRLNHEETENLNKPIVSKRIEEVIKSLPKRKAQDHLDSLVTSTKHLKK